jgi:hypothetical protein
LPMIEVKFPGTHKLIHGVIVKYYSKHER